jgi:hypothetical protein
MHCIDGLLGSSARDSRAFPADPPCGVRLLGKRRKPMDAASKRAAAAGQLTVKVPLSLRGRAALRQVKLSVRVAITPPGGAPATAVREVTLRR